MASIEKLPSENKFSLHPFVSTEFVDEFLEFFRNQPVVMSANELTEAFTEFSHLPDKWSARKLKIFLTKSQILSYSRKIPAGFSIDNSQIQEYLSTIPTSQNKVLKKSPKVIPAKEKLNRLPSPPVKTTKSLPVPAKNQRSIAESIPSFPRYLMDRIPKMAKKALNLGVAQIQALSLKQMDEYIEYLTASKMFFDSQFEKEQEVIQALNERVGFMSQLSEKQHEHQASLAFRKIFYDLYDHGKFDKIIQKWGSHYDVEQCAYLCWKKMGNKANKIFISEHALRKMIKVALLEKFPDKA